MKPCALVQLSRCRAARLARQFPALLPMLAEASLHLTGILLIGPHLTPENQEDLLARVRFRTKREIERLVAELAPVPDAPARIQPLHDRTPPLEETRIDLVRPPRHRNTWAAYVRALAGPVREMQAGIGAGQAPPAASPESNADLSARPALGAADVGAGPPQRRPAPQGSPAAGPRYRMQFTVDQAYLELLEEACQLLQHSVPGRNPVEVQRRALQALVKKLRARKFAVTERPVASEPVASPERPSHDNATEVTAPARRRHTPAAVRRSVWQRDAARCTYMDARGQRCRERGGLEFHHLEPHARGGPASIDNLTLRCRAHNALAAEQDFGRTWMAQKKNRPRQRGEGRER